MIYIVLRVLLGAMVTLSLCASAQAFEVNSYVSGSETLYLKWGDNHAGSPGGVVAWSIIPAGTPGSAYCADACNAGNSVASINVEVSPGGGFAPRTLESLRPEIRALLSRWAICSGIRFVELGVDSGVAINDVTAVPPATGQIRIGVFAFSDNSVAAVGYSPPPNGGTGAGDILLNANAFYQNYPLAEGASFDTTFAPNDLQGLLLHEMGHALGLQHPAANDGTCPIMFPFAPCDDIIRRQLRADDIAGMHFLYGGIFTDGFD